MDNNVHWEIADDDCLKDFHKKFGIGDTWFDLQFFIDVGWTFGFSYIGTFSHPKFQVNFHNLSGKAIEHWFEDGKDFSPYSLLLFGNKVN
jgi:hypothetical protein